MAKEESETTSKGRRRRIWLAVAILVLLFAAAAAWKWTPLAEQIELRKITAWAFSLRNNPARPMIILAAYLVGSLIMVPITVLIIATALVFGPTLGSVYSLAGSLLGAAVTYAVGYFLGRDFIRQITGPKWERVERKIGQAGIVAVATLRLLPVAPFTIVNVISGAFQVPIRDYTIGSLLGLAPGIVIINLFAHQMESAIRNPGWGSYLLLTALAVVSVLGTLWLRRRLGTGSG
ncbi:MAG: TVP38/TMEM64 family protein [Candidatus Binatia bacterium]